MANKRHKPEEIASKLRQVDVLVGQRLGGSSLFGLSLFLALTCGDFHHTDGVADHVTGPA